MFVRLRSVLKVRRLAWETKSCPVCGHEGGEVITPHDRYGFRVNVTLCEACGHIHNGRGLTAEAEQEFYAHHYRALYEGLTTTSSSYLHQDKGFLTAFYRFERLKSLLGKPTSLLEIGSGFGFFLAMCRWNGVENFLGFEPGAEPWRFATQRLELGEHCRNDEFSSHGFNAGAYDTAVMFHVLEHLPNPLEFLKDLKRSGFSGTLVIEVPDVEAGWDWLGRRYFHIGHRSHFSRRSLADLLQRAGYEPVFTETETDAGTFPGNLRMLALASPEARRPLTQTNFPVMTAHEKPYTKQNIQAFSLRGRMRTIFRLFAP